MPLNVQVQVRFDQLAEQAKRIQMLGRDSTVADRADFYAWSASAMNLIKGALGPSSPHFQAFQSELAAVSGNYVNVDRLDACRGIFIGAKADYEGNFVFDLERAASAEIFGDIVAAAKAALAEGNHTVAAVLACAALEDALKRFATRNQLNVEGKTMEDVVSALKSKGLVSGAQKGLLSAMPKIRNNAMHAEWDHITPQDAGSVVGFVEQFLLTQFA